MRLLQPMATPPEGAASESLGQLAQWVQRYHSFQRHKGRQEKVYININFFVPVSFPNIASPDLSPADKPSLIPWQDHDDPGIDCIYTGTEPSVILLILHSGSPISP